MLLTTHLPCVAQLKFQAHDRETYALEWHPRLANVLATGSRDNYIKVCVHISIHLCAKSLSLSIHRSGGSIAVCPKPRWYIDAHIRCLNAPLTNDFER